MNWVFSVLTLAGIAVLGVLQPNEVLDTLLQGTSQAVNMCLRLVGVYALWMGILQIADESGISRGAARLYRPLLRRMFPQESERSRMLIGLNLTANLLGLGSAATPLGIAAIESMSTGRQKATDGMIMFFILNVTAIQLLPTTIMSLRAAHGSANAADILLPGLLSSLCTALFGVAAVYLCRVVAHKRPHRAPKNACNPS